MNRPLLIVAAVGAAGAAIVVVAIGGWLIAVAGGSPQNCQAATVSDRVPARLALIFERASQRYRLGPQGASILAGLTKVESDFGRDMGPSSAGAVGWTQFLPSTWAAFGVDADGDGRRDPMSAADAIFSAARYLRHLGAPGDWRRALFGYNHADWYVDRVLHTARSLAGAISASADVLCGVSPVEVSGVHRIVGGGRIVAIPGAPGERIDERLLADLTLLMRQYRVAVTDGYAPTGHAPGGEHPLGLAVDLVPGRGGTWDDVDALAAWAEPTQNHPRPPFRWVGYDGDANHGRGNHLHLSWMHGPAPARRPPAPWVDVFAAVVP